MGRYATSGIKLTRAEIDTAFAGRWGEVYPPILDSQQAAELAGVSIKTLYDWSHRGLLKNCACRRGRHLRLLRDRFVQFLFEDGGCHAA